VAKETKMEFTMTSGTHYATGEKIVALTRSCPPDAPPAYRAARQLRAEANATGRCLSCAAVMASSRHERRKAKALGEPAHAVIVHEAWCAASDEGLERTWPASLS
jgi:hypothetical protein